MGRKTNLVGSFVLTLFFLGTCALSFVFSWYTIIVTSKQSTEEVTTQYFLTWTKIMQIGQHGSETDTTYDELEASETQNIFQFTLSFLAISTVLGMLTALFQMMATLKKSKRLKIMSGLTALLTFIGVSISVFSFFRITKALEEDQVCLFYNSPSNPDQTSCTKFIGSQDNNYYSITYRPYVGFWVGISAVFLALLSAITNFYKWRYSKHEHYHLINYH
ncbi:hypothetical protein DLAC_07613 [Tieghemostelium lacteum]|uniref:Transmembrane protein n=1 Tax=Tieghemostelium lacteum TaxID=361077 RepID=A0A151ZCY6_TIELA|nr:hypothetical protein DLAC_07613 [Tieghemostelium lacteum]|eukprot:KYQ91818.1 hypothetical protein DLAC_07613 [Tieghemostelium lacteum]